MRIALIAFVLGCGGARDPSVTGSGSGSAPPPIAKPADAPAALTIPASGPFALPADYTRCKTDEDCQMVTLGCCDEHAVNLPHVDEVRTALDASGRQHCPPKTACGPGRDGTWDGMQAACTAGTCEKPAFAVRIGPTGPIALPAEYTRCAKDTECAVVSLGCADETAVNRAHEVEVRRALVASGRAYRPPKDACGPGPKGVWDGEQGACAAGTCVIPKWPK